MGNHRIHDRIYNCRRHPDGARFAYWLFPRKIARTADAKQMDIKALRLRSGGADSLHDAAMELPFDNHGIDRHIFHHSMIQFGIRGFWNGSSK